MRSLAAVLFAVGCSWIAADAAWSQPVSATFRFPWRDPFPPVEGTPLAASAIAQPAAVLGTDGRWYLVYEIALLNTSAEHRRVDRIDVLTGDGVEVASYASPQAVRSIMTDAVQAHWFEGVDGLPASGGGMLWLDVPFERWSAIPGRIVHRVTTTAVDSQGVPTGPATSMYVAPIATDPRGPVVISPPLTGGRWVNTNGCCDVSPHTRSLQTFNGTRWLTQRFAIDWVKIDDQGAWWHGSANVNSNYFGYGETVSAAASGVVVSVLNDLPQNTPPSSLPNLVFGNALGNHVIVDIGGDRFVTYAHLQTGSVSVRAGDRVHRGQTLGKLGNSGNSAAPHLHIHVTDGASNETATSSGKPWVFTGFRLVGTLLNEEAWLSQVVVVPAQIGPVAAPAERQHQLPLLTDIVVFP